MTVSIYAKTRTAHAQEVREKKQIPAVLYGAGITPISVSVGYLDFETLLKGAGYSTLVDFSLDNTKEPVKVLIQDVQIDPVKQTIIHADFRQINMSEELHGTIELRLVGESPAVKTLGGTLIKGPEELHIRCLPKDLVGHIDIDISALATFDDVIHVRSLSLPSGITVTDNPDMVIAKVAAPLTEDEIKAMEEEGPKSVEDVEVEAKGKKEEEGAEGAEAPAKKEKKEE